MQTLKRYCEKNGFDLNKTFDMVVGEGGGILPQKTGMQGYIAHIKEDSILCTNDKLGVSREIPFSSFTEAEFGIGSGNLWLQCHVEGRPFVFCTTRGNWKAPSAQLLLEKIEQYTGEIDRKEYKKFTGKLFLLHVLLN